MMAAPAVAQAESSFYQETRSRHQQESRPAPAPRADARAQAERVDRARLERSQLNRAARHDASRRGAAPGPGRRAYLRQTFKAERRALDLNSRINRR